MTKKEETGKYTDKDGVIRWNTNKKYNKKEQAQQRDEFQNEADSGKVICLTDLMINHGM